MNVSDIIANLSTGWQWYFTTLSFLWGACCGSFLNVCIYRIPRGESVVYPRSHCPACGMNIAWYDNIPLVSYLLLRAKCRRCHMLISPRYIIVELVTAVLFLLVWLKFGAADIARPLGLAGVEHILLVPIYWLAIAGLIVATYVDVEHMIIPDRISIGGIAAGLILSGAVPAMQYGHLAAQAPIPFYLGIWQALKGATIGFGLLWGVARVGRLLFKREAMGFGDVKLLGAIGAFLGWEAVLFSIMVSSFAGSVVGISLIAAGTKRMQSRIPYGPYLALAAVIWILWGPTLWDLYVGLLTPSL